MEKDLDLAKTLERIESLKKMSTADHAKVEREPDAYEKTRFGFEPIRVVDIFGGVQLVFRFDNDFGASVVRHDGSYGSESGLWELAVIKFEGADFHLVYGTPITNDVMGYLSEKEVSRTLKKISKLEKGE